VRKRGFRGCTFGWKGGDLERITEWTAGHMLTRLGVHYLLRVRGVPMGSSISPVKASVALSDMEGTAYAKPEAARRRGFLTAHELPRQSISGKRSADDITLMSRECCLTCIKRWGQYVYRGLLLEFEEEGQVCTMCDRFIELLEGSEEGEVAIRIRRSDKNTPWVTGESSEPVRVRFQPCIGVAGCRQIAGWLQGRWSDEVAKNARDPYAADVTTLGVCSLVAELLLMGYSCGQVVKACRVIRAPELQWAVKAAKTWMQRFKEERPAARSVQHGYRFLERTLVQTMC